MAGIWPPPVLMSRFTIARAKAEAWVAAHGGQLEQTPAEAAKGAELVFTCVGNDADLSAVITGPQGAAAGMDKDTILVDHTTTSADIARNLSTQLAAQSCHMLDAPVSGGQAGAENGTLTIRLAGRRAYSIPCNLF